MILVLCPNPSVDQLVWLDTLEPGKVHRSWKEKKFPGGKGVHVALALAELGEQVTLLGFWGGYTGQWIASECRKAGVIVIGPTVKESNRNCLTIQSPSEWNETELLESGPEITHQEKEEFFQELTRQVGQCQLLVMSGSLPPGVESDFYAGCLRRSQGLSRFLDCTGEPLLLALEEKPELVHLNQSETLALTGEEDFSKSVEMLLSKVKRPALTAGSNGLYLGSRKSFRELGNSVVHASVHLDSVISSVGSGDCLVAGLAAAEIRGLNLEDSARLAVACGAANCLRPELGMLHKTDVDKLLAKVKVTNLRFSATEEIRETI